MDRYTDAYTWDAGRDDNDRQATLLWVSPGEIRYPAAVIAGMPLILVWPWRERRALRDKRNDD